jgi:hypothetical protein
LGIRRATIIKWLSQNSYSNKRGWRKNRARKYDDEIVSQRICEIKQQRIERNYFVGNEYVQMDYANYYPNEAIPTLWYIQQTVRKANLQTRKPKQRRNGGSEYLLYPVQSIRLLKGIHQSADFIGKKYITGKPEAINFFSTSYYWPFKLYQIMRIQAEKAVYAIEQLRSLWMRFPVPHVLRLDNALQFRGTASGKRALGTFLIFLLNLNVTPLLEQIDRENDNFNNESIELFRFKYAHYMFENISRLLTKKAIIKTDSLRTRKRKKLYFIRFVESFETHGDAHVTIMNETIYLPEQYTHQFIFGEWNIETETLAIYSEYKKSITLIQRIPFKLNS